MGNNKKINWLLILQGWAMLWVVIGHAPLTDVATCPTWVAVLYKFAYSFHMPLFMLVSGWLFWLTRLSVNESIWGGQKWTYAQIVKDKALRLLIPGLVFSLFAFVVKTAFPGEVDRQIDFNLREISHCFLYPYDNPLRELWFIVTLFWLMIFAPFWKIVMRKDWSMWTILCVLAVLHFINPEVELLCIGRVFSFAIWFYLGLVLCKKGIIEKVFKENPLMVLTIGIILYIGGRFSHPFIATVGGITLSFGIALLADKHIPRLFISFRNYTYQIFLMGIFAQILIKIIYNRFDAPYMPLYVLCILAGLYVPVLISKVLEYINLKPLLICVGLKEK